MSAPRHRCAHFNRTLHCGRNPLTAELLERFKLGGMLNPEDLYIMNVDALHDDLYRMGNSGSPNFGEGRSLKDCATIVENGIRIVIASGNGFSAFNFITPDMKKGAKVWRIRKGTPLPQGIRVVQDLTRQGHYM
jgi:hypothetical protein